MTTITSVELRNNFEKIIKRTMAGEEFKITYRNKPAVRLISGTPRKAGMPGLDALNKAPRKNYKFDESKSWKELYHERLDRKYTQHTNN